MDGMTQELKIMYTQKDSEKDTKKTRVHIMREKLRKSGSS